LNFYLPLDRLAGDRAQHPVLERLLTCIRFPPMDRERDYVMARLSLTLSAGAAIIAMLVMGMILLPIAPHLPSGDKKPDPIWPVH
jgi:hypothetical protein